MSVRIRNAISESAGKAALSVRRKIINAEISVQCWAERGKEALCNTTGAGAAMDIALGLIIGVVLALIVLEALKNLFNVDIMPQVTDKIDGMWS